MRLKPCDKNIPVAYYLGIDGGGTKTKCLVGDETSVLATATAGPANITRVGETLARESLHQVIHVACLAAHIDLHEIRGACIGAAGAGREEIATALKKFAAELLPCHTRVVGDMEIALQAAFSDRPGVLVIAGTGSIAYGRDAQGRTARAGGWGFAISDEGSAHWIGRESIANLLRAADRSGASQDRTAVALEPAGTLSGEITTAWNLTSLQELASIANSAPNFATLLPAVLAAADAGDASAQQILAQAAAELARLASIVLERLFPQTTATPSPVPLAMVGGVFRYSTRVREAFADFLRTAYAPVAINPNVIDPAEGALQIARAAGA